MLSLQSSFYCWQSSYGRCWPLNHQTRRTWTSQSAAPSKTALVWLRQIRAKTRLKTPRQTLVTTRHRTPQLLLTTASQTILMEIQTKQRITAPINRTKQRIRRSTINRIKQRITAPTYRIKQRIRQSTISRTRQPTILRIMIIQVQTQQSTIQLTTRDLQLSTTWSLTPI